MRKNPFYPSEFPIQNFKLLPDVNCALDQEFLDFYNPILVIRTRWVFQCPNPEFVRVTIVDVDKFRVRSSNLEHWKNPPDRDNRNWSIEIKEFLI